MNKSILKITSISHKANKQKLYLIVEVIKGKVEVNDFIFLKESFSPWASYYHQIEKIEPTNNLNELNLTVYFSEQEKCFERIQSFIEDHDLVFTGISKDEFNQMSIDHQREYFLSIVDLMETEKVKYFIHQHINNAIYFEPIPLTKHPLTKLGGLPYAANLNFPKDDKGQSVLFLGQIALSECKKQYQGFASFRGNGILYFFASLQVQDEEFYIFEDILVKYSNQISNLDYIPLPKDLERYGVFKEMSLEMIEALDLPDNESVLFDRIEMTTNEKNAYSQFVSILEQYKHYEDFKLLGHAGFVQMCNSLQAEMQKGGWFKKVFFDKEYSYEEAMELAMPESKNWLQLLSFEASDEYFHHLSNFDGIVNEHIGGVYALMIKKADLEAMNFENTTTVYQTT